MTEILTYDAGSAKLLRRCAAALDAGELIILPTDTVYGLTAKADVPRAVEAVFTVKGRSAAKALVVMVSSLETALRIAAPERRGALRKLGSLWPGPLTLVVEAGDVPWRRDVAPGSEELGLRIPDNPFLLRLLEVSGPLAVTSANTAGMSTPDSFGGIEEGLLGAVAVAVDGGRCGSGRPSTVARISGDGIEVLRRGQTEEEAIRRALEAGGTGLARR